MDYAATFTRPELIRSKHGAVISLARGRNAIHQANYIGWPALAVSFSQDEHRLKAMMAERGWKVPAELSAPISVLTGNP